MERVILHSDMNNFYASVECMLNPELKAYPIAVCGDVEERHGIVLAKNYKAKAKGVSTGEAIWQAKQKCPGLLIVSPHYDEYMKYSKKARAIYGRYTDEIEAKPSLRGYFSLTERLKSQIRQRLFQDTVKCLKTP